MVGTFSQRYACEASGAEGVEHHRIMKPSSRNHQLGWSSGNTRRAQDDNTKTPTRTETGLDAKENIHVSAEGRGKTFFLTSPLIGSTYHAHPAVELFCLSAFLTNANLLA